MAIHDKNLADNFNKVLILLGIASFLCSNAWAQIGEENEKSTLGKYEWQQLWQDLSLYAPIHTLFHDEAEQATSDSEQIGSAPMFTDEEILIFKDVFKFLPTLKDSAFGDILEKGSIPSDFVSENGDTFENVLEEYTQSEEFTKFMDEKVSNSLAQFLEQLTENIVELQEETVGLDSLGNEVEEDVDDTAEGQEQDLAEDEHDQVGGWEGCRRDYNALALPWTNNILARVAQAVIERQIPEETFKCNDTCEKVCLTLPIGGPVICRTACDMICANTTYHDLVDLVVSVLFPPMPKTRWNRASELILLL